MNFSKYLVALLLAITIISCKQKATPAAIDTAHTTKFK
jgi:hypothetical protein